MSLIFLHISLIKVAFANDIDFNSLRYSFNETTFELPILRMSLRRLYGYYIIFTIQLFNL